MNERVANIGIGLALLSTLFLIFFSIGRWVLNGEGVVDCLVSGLGFVLALLAAVAGVSLGLLIVGSLGALARLVWELL